MAMTSTHTSTEIGMSYYEQLQWKSVIWQRRKKKNRADRDSLLQSKPQKFENFTQSEPVDDAVVNISNAVLTTEELALLNKGLNYAVAPIKSPINEVIVAIGIIFRQKWN